MREGGAGSPPGGATVREGQGAPPPSPLPAQEEEATGWLPPALAANWRRIKPLPARGAEADLYVVGPRDPSLDTGADARRVIKVYREDINPKAEVLELVKGADPSHVVWLEDYGKDQGRWWERMEYAEQGSLRQLLEREGPKLPDDLVLEILRQLNDALAALHALPLEHRDLKPGNVLVRSRDPLDVILTDFGIATLMAQSRRHTDTARTIRYAPPESLGRKVVIEKTALDYWSLGMMLVEMLRGEHPFEGLEEAVIVTELATQNVDDLTEGVEDPDWRKLCRGLLRRAPADRWGAADVSRWIEDSKDPGLEVAEEAAPARPSAAAPSTATIDFDGASYGTPAELGAALARDWSKADSFWKRRLEDVRTWATDGLGLQPLGDAMAGIDDSDLPLEAQVFSFVYLLAPEAPLRFRDADISMDGLAALGERAANQGDAGARDILLMLYRQKIPMLAGVLPGREEHAEVSRRWDEAVSEYERLRSEFATERYVELPKLDDDRLVVLLAGAIPSEEVLASLRKEAGRAATRSARKRPWFRALGTPGKMPVAVLAILPGLQGGAERQAREYRMRPVRGCVGGLVVGGLFGRWVRWVDGQRGRFDLNDFGDFFGLVGGLIQLAVVIFAFFLVLAWYREGAPGVGRMLRRRSEGVAGAWRSVRGQPDGAQRQGAAGAGQRGQGLRQEREVRRNLDDPDGPPQRPGRRGNEGRGARQEREVRRNLDDPDGPPQRPGRRGNEGRGARQERGTLPTAYEVSEREARRNLDDPDAFLDDLDPRRRQPRGDGGGAQQGRRNLDDLDPDEMTEDELEELEQEVRRDFAEEARRREREKRNEVIREWRRQRRRGEEGR